MNKYASLTPETLRILKDKGTEMPFSGKYYDKIEDGSYLCRGCGTVLFRSNTQFYSSCGWPSFDDEMKHAIKRQMDQDGHRTEILCTHCHGHLGHVFIGERITEKNQRHCVNSLAIEFVSNTNVLKTGEAIVAGGCFWGVEYLFEQLSGILLTEVGYIGGTTDHPSYKQVCDHQTEHLEAVRIVFDSNQLSYEDVIKYFFEIHNPTQADGQGPDIGSQYLSCIFYFDEEQKAIVNKIIAELENNGLTITTQLKPVTIFWPAEEYHQQYYKKNNHTPYCHRHIKRF